MSVSYDRLFLDHQLCFPLYACSREVIRQYKPHLDRIGLTYTQYLVMMVLWQEETISAKELGKRLYLDSGTLTPLLKKLESRNLLTRQRDPMDERVLQLTLTGAGRALRDEALHIPDAVGSCIRLAPEEAQQLYVLLYKVLQGLEENP